MADRTLLPRQGLSLKTGQVLTEFTITATEVTNGMRVRPNTGKIVVVVKAAAGGSVNAAFLSVANKNGRTGNVPATAVTSSTIKTFGPFAPPTIWGDGSDLLIDLTTLVGTVTIAAIEVEGS